MAIVMYPRCLLEAWAKLGLCDKTVSRPVMESRRHSREDSTGDVDSDFGNFSDIRDYEGEDDLGYAEPGVDTELDDQYGRFGVPTEEEIDPETGETVEPGTGARRTRKAKKKGESGDSNYKVIADAVRTRRLADSRNLYGEIAEMAGRYLDCYDSAPAKEMPGAVSDNIAQLRDDLERTYGTADDYLGGVQRLVRDMETLGIAARESGAVPGGIPEKNVTVEQLTALVYLSAGDARLISEVNDPKRDQLNMLTGVLSTTRMAKRVKAINDNIAGLGTGTEPLMPGPGENVYTSSLAAWNSRLKSAGANLSSNRIPADKNAEIDNAALGAYKVQGRRNVEYLGTDFSGSATVMVPHTLFVSVCGRIEGDQSKLHRKSREDLLEKFGGSIETAAANLMVYGYNALVERFGVSFPRMAETTSACFIAIPRISSGTFTSTTVCLNALKDMLTAYRGEIATKRAQLVDYGGSVFESFPESYLYPTKGNAAGNDRMVSVVEMFDLIIATIERNMGGSPSMLKEFASSELYALLEKSFSLKRKARKVRENGAWKVSSGEKVPLFDFFATERNAVQAVNIDARKGSGSSSFMNTGRAVGETISYDDIPDYMGTRTTDTANSSYIETCLTDRRIANMCEFLGIPAADMPTPDSTEKERVKFFTDFVIKFSENMRSLGATSYIVRRPGNGLEDVVSDEDRDAYGNDIGVLDVWQKLWQTLYDEAKKGNRELPGIIRAVVGNNLTKHSGARSVFVLIKHILVWLRSFQSYDYNADDIVTALTDVGGEFKKAQEILDPYIEMVPLVISIAGSDKLAGSAGKGSDEFRLAISFINRMQKELNVNVLSSKFIGSLVDYARLQYGDEAEMLDYASKEAPYEWNEMLEWCLVRFLMSGIKESVDGSSGRRMPTGGLIPPEQVDAGDSGSSGEDHSGAVSPVLAKYRDILARKPAYLKRDAWLRQNNIDPATYDYLEQEASGTRHAERIIDMSVGEIAGWLSDVYLKKGNLGEVIMLLVSMLHIGTRIHDDGLRTVSTFSDRHATDKMYGDSMQQMVLLTDAMREYGGDFIGNIVSGFIGDNGEALHALMEILGAQEPFTVEELGAILDGAEDDTENDASVGEDDLAPAMGRLLGKLSAAPFLTFNGLA